MKRIFITAVLFLGIVSNSLGATYSQTKLLLHLNGENGANTYTSDDAGARTVTFYHSAHLTTSQKVFGTASLELSSSTRDCIFLDDDSAWNIGYEDFTMDCRIRMKSLPSSNTRMSIISSGAGTTRWDWGIFGGTPSGIYMGFQGLSAGNWKFNFSSEISPSINTWYHLALVRSGTVFYQFIDGSLIDYYNDTDSFPNPIASLTIGAGLNGSANFLDAEIDELRIVVGSAEWTTAFTPPTEEYSFADAASTGDFFSLF
jgi:hypothetical protein